MRKVKRKKLNIVLAESEGEESREKQQYLQQQKM
jgi:hypothetical protein